MKRFALLFLTALSAALFLGAFSAPSDLVTVADPPVTTLAISEPAASGAGYAAAISPASLQPDGSGESTIAEYAMSWVRFLADDIGPRPAGTDAERRAATAIADELVTLGYAVETLPFRFSVSSGSGTSQNVAARDANEDPNLPLVIIGAHYDSVPQSPGANDNASGTGTMLAVARQLARVPVEGVTVRYVAFGAEEIGLLGAKEYVAKLSRADRARLRVVLSIDMMSVGDQPAFGGSEPWITDAMARANSQGYRSENLSGYLRRLSDHAPFLDEGLPALMFHWVDDPFYHTRLDVSSNVQVRALDLMGAIAIELVRLAALR